MYMYIMFVVIFHQSPRYVGRTYLIRERLQMADARCQTRCHRTAWLLCLIPASSYWVFCSWIKWLIKGTCMYTHLMCKWYGTYSVQIKLIPTSEIQCMLCMFFCIQLAKLQWCEWSSSIDLYTQILLIFKGYIFSTIFVCKSMGNYYSRHVISQDFLQISLCMKIFLKEEK